MRLGYLAGWFAATCLGLGTYAMAQSAPDDRDVPPAPPAAPVPPTPAPQADRDPGAGPIHPDVIRAERRLWVGLSVSPVTPVIAHQLKLPPGVGFVVDEVTPDGPASKAGVKQYDVLHKLDDQVLVNPEQLSTLVQMHKPGDQITLSVFREGQSIDVKVTLEQGGVQRMVPFDRHPGAMPRPDGRIVPPRPPLPGDEPASRRPGPEDMFRKLRIPNVKLRIEDGDLVAKDEAGHTLFRQPLELNIDDDRFPFSIHIHAKNPNRHDSDPRPDSKPQPERPNAGDAVPDRYR